MDARVPVMFVQAGASVPPETAVLVEGHGVVPEGAAVVVKLARDPGRFAACNCCLPRGAAAQALGHLFMARAKGEVAFFRQVFVITPDEPAMRAVLGSDILVTARYSLPNQ